MAHRSCPICGEPRIGNFAFCRNCGLDYDAYEAGLPGSAGRHPVTEAGSATLGPPLATPSVETMAAPGAAQRPPATSARRRLVVVATLVGAVVIVVGSVGWAMRPADPPVLAQTSTYPTPTVAARQSPLPAESATPSLAAVLSATDAPSSPEPSIPATVALPTFSAKVAGATAIRYFSVVGDSPIDLIEQTVERSKPLCKSDDTLACVVNSYQPKWIETTNRSTGSCKVTSLRITLKSTVSLPRWTGPSRVQPALITWWKAFADHLAWHEGQHIAIQKSYDSKLKSLLVGHRCSSARGIIAKWERSLQAAQDQFDVKDQAWPYPDYDGPGGFLGLG